MKILKDIKEVYGGCLIKIPKKKHCHQQWALRLSGWGAIKLIKDVFPYLRVREKQARLAIIFMKYRKENNGNKYSYMKLPSEHSEFYEDCRRKMN